MTQSVLAGHRNLNHSRNKLLIAAILAFFPASRQARIPSPFPDEKRLYPDKIGLPQYIKQPETSHRAIEFL